MPKKNEPFDLKESLQEEMDTALQTLVFGNITGIAKELQQSEDGTLSVGFSVKLSLSGKRVAGVGSLSYSRKFKDEIEFITADPDQLKFEDIEKEGGEA